MKKMNIAKLMVLILSTMVLLGCAPGSGHSTIEHPAGFFMGIWHGWIAPISLIWGLFNPDIRIYETNNIGWLYDLGFYIAVISGFGGLSLFRRRHKETV